MAVWPEAVQWVLWLWGLPEGAGQGQPLPVFRTGPPGMSYKAIFRWLLLVLGLEVPRRGQAANQGCWLLVQGPRPEAQGKREHAKSRCCLSERF